MSACGRAAPPAGNGRCLRRGRGPHSGDAPSPRGAGGSSTPVTGRSAGGLRDWVELTHGLPQGALTGRRGHPEAAGGLGPGQPDTRRFGLCQPVSDAGDALPLGQRSGRFGDRSR